MRIVVLRSTRVGRRKDRNWFTQVWVMSEDKGSGFGATGKLASSEIGPRRGFPTCIINQSPNRPKLTGVFKTYFVCLRTLCVCPPDVGFPPELRFTYGNDPKFFFHFHYEKVPEIRNSGSIPERLFYIHKTEISGILFRNSGPFLKIVPENSGLRKNRSGIFRE